MKLLANLTDANDGDAMDKLINSLSKMRLRHDQCADLGKG